MPIARFWSANGAKKKLELMRTLSAVYQQHDGRCTMKIEVCGSGCSKCAELEKRAKEAVSQAAVNATVEHVYDMAKIIERGIFITPALLIDGKTVASGKIPSVEEIASLLKR
jgi:small redox-active disulfide protein 2